MAITAYTGLPGSGKSYSVVENVILPALDQGKRVTTNIPLSDSLLQKYAPNATIFEISDLTDNLAWFQDVFVPGATLVIDECWRLWSSGLRANNMEVAHKSFLAEHRHMVGLDGQSTEICLVTQDLSQIAAYPRSLIETTYRTTKLNAIGQNKRFRIDIYEGAVTGQKPPEKLRLRQIFGKYKPEVYQYYCSQTMSASASYGDESGTDKRTNILSSKWLLVGAPVLVLVFGAFIIYSMTEVSAMYNPEVKELVSVKPVPAVAFAPAVVIPLEKKPDYRHFYEGMSGYISFNNGWLPDIDYHLTFRNGSQSVTLTAVQLKKMGYTIRGYHSCYVQLSGHGSDLHLFCERQQEKKQGIFQVSNPFASK